MAQKKENGNILELCCGTGRLTIPLVQEGYHITGIDNSTAMLKQAKAKKLNLPISFLNADIRTLKLPELYDVIFIPYNSIHHLYIQIRIFLMY
jgi:ubiquinone/menaquinone biosynthesis C-methylase UbiE